ncbi:MAG TPA: carboxypeptidase regulatory-like domain-containing protein [Vicinamibacterales bacterium]|nr:carboxypeptidase regulatory-like domain-containing protein [Vicinamibacterales bacterium]
MARVSSTRVVFLGGAVLVAAFNLLPVAAQAPASPAAERLPVRRVVLYKSGIGYFEHLGRVRGNQDVTIEFTSGQLDDVLKSLTALDLDGGRVASVNYNSDAGVERRLSALRLSLGPSATRTDLLRALRGARVETRSGATTTTGRLLNVEQQQRRVDGEVTTVDAVSLVTNTGDIRTIVLDSGVTVRILEADLNEEVGRYLSIISSSREQDVRRLTISTAGQGERDLFVSYVSEVPVWKSTYRLVLGTEGSGAAPVAPVLQGWAIVDNTIGEDWTNVELSLVAGAPQAFIQRISQPYYVQRPIVPLPERVLMAPQTHQGSLTTAGAGGISGMVTDSAGGVLPGVTVRVTRNGSLAGTALTDGRGAYRVTGLAPGNYDVVAALSGFNTATANGVRVSGGTETALNHSLEIGAMSEEIAVSAAAPVVSFAPPPGRAVRAGRGGGAGSVMDRVESAQAALQASATGEELGDLFEYRLKAPITILKNQSALVPIVNGTVGAEKVSIWNAESSSSRPLRAVWVTNSTGQTLDAGSVSIVEGQAFAGEGLIESLKAGERRLLSYAQDLAMTVTVSGDPSPARLTRMQLTRGVLIQQREERHLQTYTARNDDQQTRTLVVEHPVRAGWTLGGQLKPVETTPTVHRYRVTVAPGTTSTFTVEETRTTDTRVVVASITDNQVQVWTTGGALDPATLASLREVLRRKTVVADLSAQVQARETESATIGRDQERVRENMKSLKGTAEERQLVQRYVRQLDSQETRLEELRAEIARLTTQRNEAQAELNRFIETLGG